MRLLQIKDRPNYWVSTDGDVYHYKNAKYIKMKPHLHGGYYRICIQGCKYYISHLVLDAFKPNNNKKLKAYHIDGDKRNNKLTNLIWATPSQIQLWARMLPEYRARE